MIRWWHVVSVIVLAFCLAFLASVVMTDGCQQSTEVEE